ncbi:unnamed protein product, partial [Mesorhabditis spiculigera]
MLPIVLEPSQIAGFFVFIASLSGILANGAVVWWVTKLPLMQNSFGRLARNQALAGFCHGCGFLFYFSPMLMMKLTLLKSAEVSAYFGHFQLICYDACNASHFFISLNRVTAIFFPLHYDYFFTRRNVLFLNILAWLYAFLPSIWAYRIADCRLIYSNESWGYVFAGGEICGPIGWWYDVYKTVATIALIVLLDLTTFVKCRIHGSQLIDRISDAQTRARKKNEIHFVTQAYLQGSIFLLELATYFIFSQWVEEKMLKFLLTTLAWILVHAIDGMVAIAFNREFARKCRESGTSIGKRGGTLGRTGKRKIRTPQVDGTSR